MPLSPLITMTKLKELLRRVGIANKERAFEAEELYNLGMTFKQIEYELNRH
jgi:hypothetical protein